MKGSFVSDDLRERFRDALLKAMKVAFPSKTDDYLKPLVVKFESDVLFKTHPSNVVEYVKAGNEKLLQVDKNAVLIKAADPAVSIPVVAPPAIPAAVPVVHLAPTPVLPPPPPPPQPVSMSSSSTPAPAPAPAPSLGSAKPTTPEEEQKYWQGRVTISNQLLPHVNRAITYINSDPRFATLPQYSQIANALNKVKSVLEVTAPPGQFVPLENLQKQSLKTLHAVKQMVKPNPAAAAAAQPAQPAQPVSSTPSAAPPVVTPSIPLSSGIAPPPPPPPPMPVPLPPLSVPASSVAPPPPMPQPFAPITITKPPQPAVVAAPAASVSRPLQSVAASSSTTSSALPLTSSPSLKGQNVKETLAKGLQGLSEKAVSSVVSILSAGPANIPEGASPLIPSAEPFQKRLKMVHMNESCSSVPCNGWKCHLCSTKIAELHPHPISARDFVYGSESEIFFPQLASIFCRMQENVKYFEADCASSMCTIQSLSPVVPSEDLIRRLPTSTLRWGSDLSDVAEETCCRAVVVTKKGSSVTVDIPYGYLTRSKLWVAGDSFDTFIQRL